MKYRSSNPQPGVVMAEGPRWSIGVLGEGENRIIGHADPRGWRDDGAAIWKLHVDGREFHGLFILRDGTFEPVG